MEWLPELVESEEAPNMLTALRRKSLLCALVNPILTDVGWIPDIPVSLAVGGSVAVLAAVAGAAWMHDRKKARTILSLQKELAEQRVRSEASQKRITKQDTAFQKQETTINALLVVAQRAAEVDSKLRDDHSSRLDGVQKRLGALAADNAGYRKKLQKSGNVNTALLVIVQRAAEAEEKQQADADADSLRAAKEKVESLEDSLKNTLSRSAEAEQALKNEIQGLNTVVGSLKLDYAAKQTSTDKLSEELNTRISVCDEANRALTSDVKTLNSRVVSLEQAEADSKANLKRAVDGERKAVFEQASLKDLGVAVDGRQLDSH